MQVQGTAWIVIKVPFLGPASQQSGQEEAVRQTTVSQGARHLAGQDNKRLHHVAGHYTYDLIMPTE